MTASVWVTVVRNKRLPLKARPRSAASLAGRGGLEAGRPVCQSGVLLRGTTCGTPR